jgi:hypothetical protein
MVRDNSEPVSAPSIVVALHAGRASGVNAEKEFLMRMFTVATLAFAVIAAAHAASPVFIIDATPTDPKVLAVIGKYVRDSDFVRLRDIGADPALAAKVRVPQRFDDYRSLELVRAQVSRGCAERPTDLTVWYYTPTEGPEYLDVLGSVTSAVRLIHTSPCLQAGISSSAEFWGYKGPCAYDLESSPYKQVDWTQVDRVMIRGEGWLKAGCTNGVAGYQKFMAAVTGYVRSRNPRIQVYAHMSLRYTPPAMMVEGIRELTSNVDGFSLGYPLHGEHVYCTPENLEAVLSTRSEVPR